MKCMFYNPNSFRKETGDDWARFNSVYNFIPFGQALIDRTNTIKFPVATSNADHLQLPVYDDNFAMSYLECCLRRAQELFQLQDSQGSVIKLLYSGGIDSSMVLSSFIHAFGIDECAKRIEIIMSHEGIYENPWMWSKIIRPHFTISNSESFENVWQPNSIVVGGEGNDQLMGVEHYKHLISWGGTDVMSRPISNDHIAAYLKPKLLSDANTECWMNVLNTMRAAAPCKVETVSDYWWWFNFNCKWSTVYWRMLAYSQSGTLLTKDYLTTHYQQFFNTPYFQQWGMKDREHKHRGDYTGFKFHTRELVAKIIDSPEYLFKSKRGSLYDITKIKKSYSVIDNNYVYHTSVNPGDWYDANNSFT